MLDSLPALITSAWEDRDALNTDTQGEIREAVDAALSLLDSGEVRVADPGPDGWTVNQWLKKAVLLSFRLNDNKLMDGGPGHRGTWWDKVPSKFEGWGEAEFKAAGFRAVPPAAVRRGCICCAGRCTHAVLRQYRRLCRQGHDDRHLGIRRLMRSSWCKLPYLSGHWHWRRA